MCGIVGAFAYQSAFVSRDEILRVRDAMANRGPDSAGFWISADRKTSLGHRRLSILDLSDVAAQPMLDERTGNRIVFNGEIYNFKELRDELIRNGNLFVSNSDTEVLLRLYEQYGAQMLSRLRGMFAFAIWDARRRRLFLARDPFGMKPLYWSDEGGVFRFASQVKALVRGGGISLEPNYSGYFGFMLWGFVPEPHTLYSSIKALSAGSYMFVDMAGAGPPHQYYSVSDSVARSVSPGACKNSAWREIRKSFSEAVALHLVADVPVGVFLSSGADSRAIAAVAAKLSKEKLRTVTIGFTELRGTFLDETPQAEKVARQLGTRHVTSWVSFKEFSNDFRNILEQMDQPSVDGVNTYFVSKVAKSLGLKVALSGIGGDELFGGYPGFRQIPKLASALSVFRYFPSFSGAFRTASAPILSILTSPKYASVLEYGHSLPSAYFLRRALFMPWEIEKIFSANFGKSEFPTQDFLGDLYRFSSGISSAHYKLLSLEFNVYLRNQLLRDADWAGMANGVEIRAPFVDRVFFEKALSFQKEGRPISKQDFAREIIGDQVADFSLHNKKGFDVPISRWISVLDSDGAGDRNVRGWAKLIFDHFARQNPIMNRSRESASSGSRVLIHRIGLLGDTIVALPAFQAIRDHYPNSHITLMYDRRLGQITPEEVLRPTGLVDSYMPYDAKAGVLGLMRLFFQIRRRNFSTLVYLAPSGRSRWQFLRDRIAFSLMGISIKIGASYKVFRRVERSSGHHERDFLLDILGEYGVRAPDRKPELFNKEMNLGDAFRRIVGVQKSSLPGKMLVALAPGSNMQSKKWPVKCFESLGARLISELDVFPIVLGGVAESEIGDSLVGKWGRGINLAGKADIESSYLVLRECDLYVGNDTGTMHLAAYAGTRCVAIFSSRDVAGKWFPYGDNHVVLRKDMPCSGCMKVECEVSNSCVSQISVEEVLNACSKITHEN